MLLAQILGISTRKSQVARILIATKRYILPRHLRFGRCAGLSRDDVREVIVGLDGGLLANIFGAPAPNPSLAVLRQHAFKMLGMAIDVQAKTDIFGSNELVPMDITR